MTTITITYRTTYRARSPLSEFLAEHTRWLESRLPRPCMLVSVGLLLVGLCIPALMAFFIIPASLLVGFIGMVCACLGTVLTFYYL